MKLLHLLVLFASVNIKISYQAIHRLKISQNFWSVEEINLMRNEIDQVQIEEEWTSFKNEYNKVYSSKLEERKRFNIFLDNLEHINWHNEQFQHGKVYYRKGVNQFTDLTYDELIPGTIDSDLQLSHLKSFHEYNKDNYSDPLPESVDWRKEGLVTRVKNQRFPPGSKCGSCYAFSAVGAIESLNAKTTGQLNTLSEQNVIDCSGPEGNRGCKDGWPENVYEYVMKEKGIDTDRSYPYFARVRHCRFKKENVGATIEGYMYISDNETALQEAVARTGPVSACFHATKNFFQYSKGLFVDDTCSREIMNHCIVIVGYGVDDETGLKYWIIKNSYGLQWGRKGYMKMARNHNNMCNIASHASYPY